MVQFAGKYELTHNEKFYEFLINLGIPEENAKKVDSLKPVIVVKVEGDKYSIDSNSGFKNASVTFKLNEEFDDPMPNNMILKSTAALEGYKLIIKSKAGENRTGDRTYEFSDAGCVVTMTSSFGSVIAKRHYKKL